MFIMVPPENRPSENETWCTLIELYKRERNSNVRVFKTNLYENTNRDSKHKNPYEN